MEVREDILPDRDVLLKRYPFRSDRGLCAHCVILDGATCNLRHGSLGLSASGVILDDGAVIPCLHTDGLRGPTLVSILQAQSQKHEPHSEVCHIYCKCLM